MKSIMNSLNLRPSSPKKHKSKLSSKRKYQKNVISRHKPQDTKYN